jgi:hypothetical protein
VLSAAGAAKIQEICDFPGTAPVRVCPVTANPGRSTLSYEPRPVPAAELAIMCRIDALRLDYPFAGSRMLRDLLRGENVVIGRDMVRTMMRRMCIEALHRRPNTSKAAPGHKIYPYLLRGLAIERPNQVWCMCGRPPERKVFCVIRRSERVRSCLRPSTRCLYDRWPMCGRPAKVKGSSANLVAVRKRSCVRPLRAAT